MQGGLPLASGHSDNTGNSGNTGNTGNSGNTGNIPYGSTATYPMVHWQHTLWFTGNIPYGSTGVTGRALDGHFTYPFHTECIIMQT